MRTARSSSRQSEGGLPQCMLGYTTPQLWAWRPPRCGPGDPPGVALETTPQCVGLETPLPGQSPQPPLWVWAWRPPSLARPLNLPPGVGLEIPPDQTPQLPPWVWAWRPPWLDPWSSPLGVGMETCKECWVTHPPGGLQGMLRYHSPPDR